MGLRIGSVCSGVGGLELGVTAALPDAEVVWHTESNARIARVLDHHLPHVTNLGDITRVPWNQVPRVDVLTGGTPCQDLSVAGHQRGMSIHTRSGLWGRMAAAIAALKPALVIWENVRGALLAPADSALEHCPRCMGDHRPAVPLRALGRVLGDLAALGYDARWGCVNASQTGAPHRRQRLFVVAHPAGEPGFGRWLATPWQAPGGRAHPEPQGRGRALPTPRTSDRRGAAAHGTGGADLRTAVATLPRHRGLPPLPVLLPTPVVNDMGENKSVDGWDAWTAKLLATCDNRNGHGKSLAIEVRRGGWGRYGPAIRRWESILRPAPVPVIDVGGKARLNPAFSEWMLGLPAGWVSAVPGMARVWMHTALGNACSPQQAHLALTLLLADEEWA